MIQKLGRRLYGFIERGAKTTGTLKPSLMMYVFEEELTFAEYKRLETFLQWCHDNGKTIGHGNYEERYAEFQEDNDNG